MFKISQIMSNILKIIWGYQQPNDGKRMAKCWWKVDQKLTNCWQQNVGPTSPKHWHNVALMLAECWRNVAPMMARRWANVGLMLGGQTNWHRTDVVVPTSPRDLSSMVGPTSAQLIDASWFRILASLRWLSHFMELPHPEDKFHGDRIDDGYCRFGLNNLGDEYTRCQNETGAIQYSQSTKADPPPSVSPFIID